MVTFHVLPRIIGDFQKLAKELEGPLSDDVENAKPLVEVLKSFDKIQRDSMEYVLCPYFLPTLIETLEQWIDIIQTDFTEAYNEAK